MDYTIIKNYEEYLKIIENKPIVLLQLYADWCKPCERISIEMQLIDWFYGKKEEIEWIKINVDELENMEDNELKEMFEYKKIPTFYFLHEKKIINMIETSDKDKLCLFMKMNIQNIYYNYEKIMNENNLDF